MSLNCWNSVEINTTQIAAITWKPSIEIVLLNQDSTGPDSWGTRAILKSNQNHSTQNFKKCTKSQQAELETLIKYHFVNNHVMQSFDHHTAVTFLEQFLH